VSFDIILPFLRPIEHLLKDDSISEIMVNGSGGTSAVVVERLGRLQHVPGVSLTETALQVACRYIARYVGDDISTEKPFLDARLPDGSRVAAMFPPCSVEGTTLTIRKFDARRFTLSDLVEIGTITPDFIELFRAAVLNRRNILISGGAGTGKTTLLNAVASLIPEDERIITIEDTAEIHIRHSDRLRFEARRQQSGWPAVSVRELLRASLRHRPDRIIVGEVRGEEAFDLLQALNTGHSGSLSTIHADSASLALSRFTNCILESGVRLPFQAMRRSIADSLHLIVHIKRSVSTGARAVSEVLEITGYDVERDRFNCETVYPGSKRSAVNAE
jgi:pilus assembly protein CpaF